MRQKYTKVEELWSVIQAKKEQGQTNRSIGAELGLTLKQVKKLVTRQNHKQRLIAAGYVPQPKGRPRKMPESESEFQHNEIVKLRMQVELLRNFLSEAGRR